jgi:dihydrodipicolinate synthase/N-acetylneuraminate lyase
MHHPSRRRFLQQVGAVSTAATVALPAHARAIGTAEHLSVGVIGVGGRGSGLLKTFRQIADVAYVCDPDEARRESTMTLG